MEGSIVLWAIKKKKVNKPDIRHKPVIPALRRLEQEEYRELGASLGYVANMSPACIT